jgi:C-terminal processing protease CtpA/Prc
MLCAIWQVPISTKPDHQGVAEYDTSGRWDVPPELPRLKGRLIFLIDGRAISAAETAMGIVEAYRLADIVGEPTAGTNGNVNPFTVPGGYVLSWTGMRVLKHDGSRHHGVGILPTHPVSRTIKGITERRDEILEKALELARAH